MCNPRRVEGTATRQIRESWEREVRRLAEVGTDLTGEARIRQALDDSVGAPALLALQTRLAGDCEGWDEQADGSYRHAVEGGYVSYRQTCASERTGGANHRTGWRAGVRRSAI
jgi:hypothetical protein